MIRPILTTCCLLLMLAAPAVARTPLKNICRIKGQEENRLIGQGLVVGLNGTGEANDPMTMRALAQAMGVMHNPLATNGQPGELSELRKMKNVALVMVSATIPATGARRGDQLDCYVMALNGKSLQGGRLAFASMQGPNTQDPRLYAQCQGQVIVDDSTQPMVGVIPGGCLMEADIFTPFIKDGCLTLVLEQYHANFQTAAMIAKEIDRKFGYGALEDGQGVDMAYAKDATNIVVRIPQDFVSDPVDFASYVLDLSVDEYEPESRVVINSRAGSIVISGEVEIGDVIVSHKNITVEAEAPTETFAQIDVDSSNQPRLQDLINQLNALRVPTTDMIDIIRGIERNGKLHGKLIVDGN